MKINILSLAITKHNVDSIVEVVRFLEKRGHKINHFGFVDNFGLGRNLEGVRTEAMNAYKEYDIRVFQINSFKQALEIIKNLEKNKYPHVFIVDNERPLASFLANYFEKKNIPTVMIDHGFLTEPPFIYQNPALGLIKKIIDNFKHNPALPPGLKSNSTICCFCEKNRLNYLKYGVPAERLKKTGYPYIDEIIRIYHSLPKKKKQNIKRKKILIISSGIGYLRNSKIDAEKFCRFVIDISKILSKNHNLTLRFKPGEKIYPLLSEKTINDLKNAHLKIDDSKKRSIFAILDYDLAIGDASMVMFETVMLGKPILIFRYSDLGFYDKHITSSFKGILGAKVIKKPEEISNLFPKLFSNKYILSLRKGLSANNHYLFYSLDGKAASRVGKVVLEAISSSKR